MTHCYGSTNFCEQCGEPLLAPNQVCSGPTKMDEVTASVVGWPASGADFDEPVSRRDWAALLRALRRECHYLARRARRPTSEPGGADERNLARLRRLEPVLARAAGEISQQRGVNL